MNENAENWDEGLKTRERLFVLHYCTNDLTFLNATASYKVAYQKKDRTTGKIIKLDKKTCESAGSRLIKRDNVRLAISRLLKLTQADLDERNSYQLLHDLFVLSTYNTSDIIDEKGGLKCKKLSDLGELSKCVTEIYQTKMGLHVKLADRSKYMSQLLQYLDLIKPEIKVDAELPVIEMVQKAINPETWNEIAAKAD